ncbi:response regulator transcription factor [Streptosporangiaceae bacterium NEAU-GS5]|nr:response regulator transcription factor [Streptosporangiaceae bacterium NEAU-GS5]
MIRVLVVDDERLVCAHLRTILCAAPDIEVVAEAYDGAEAVEAVLLYRPDLVLMDLRMPGVDGLTAIEQIGRLDPPSTVVALTTFDLDGYVLRAMRAGAAGYLLKDTAPDDLVALVRVAAGGHLVFSPSAVRRLLTVSGDLVEARVRARARLTDLTARELEVLTYLGLGMSNQQIGRRLYLSEATVKGHISRLLVKVDCANRTQAGLLAREAELWPPKAPDL